MGDSTDQGSITESSAHEIHLESDADSVEMTLISVSELDECNMKQIQYASDSDSEVGADDDAETTATVVSSKRRYPYGPLFFIMAATTGQRYT